MSRTLKRPMFRRGGKVNEGIMSGLVDRKNYQENGFCGTIDRERAKSKHTSYNRTFRRVCTYC
jgi:hypothetical protein